MGAEIPAGAVLVARAITNSSLWTMRSEDRILAITCICMANWRPKSWFDGERSTSLERGQFITSLENLAEAAKLTIRSVRTSLKNLEKVGFLTRKVTQRWTLVSVCKYDHYQKMENYYDTKADTQLTADRHQTDIELPTTKESNKGIREEGGGEPPSSPIGMLLKKAELQCIPGKVETKVSYFKAWQARTDYTRAEQIIMDPWSKGKTILEIHDHFFPKDKAAEMAARRDASGPRKI